MALRACAGCGAIAQGRLCENCAGPLPASPTSWNGRRDRGTQAVFRRHVLAAAGGRCQGIELDGTRCVETEGQAHHLEPGNDDPATGAFLCRRHHRLVDEHAR